MAEYLYSTHLLKSGYHGTYDREFLIPETYFCLTDIDVRCEPDGEVLYIPSSFGDSNLLTHIGYEQGYEEAYEDWIDWQHGKGMSYPQRYFLKEISFKPLPDYIKKVVIPETVQSISKSAFDMYKNVIFEVHPDNPFFRVENNRLVKKDDSPE